MICMFAGVLLMCNGNVVAQFLQPRAQVQQYIEVPYSATPEAIEYGKRVCKQYRDAGGRGPRSICGD